MPDNSRFRRRPLLVAALVGLGLLAVAAVLLLADPFGWNLFDKASGLRDDAAGAMPPTVGLYASIDLINFSEETLTKFSQPFVTALAEPGIADLGAGLDRLDARTADEIGLTLSEDIKPWLGRSVGLGLTDLVLRPDGSVDRVGWLLVAGTQDRRAADDFLVKLGQQISQRYDVAAATDEYRGRTITTFGPAQVLAQGGLAYTRSAGQLMFASDVETVRSAIDAQHADSLAESEPFRNLVQSLPPERGLTLYADQAQLPALGRLLATDVPLAVGPLDLTSLILPPGALGVTIVDQGLRLDTAAPGDEVGGTTSTSRQMAGLFPSTTLALASGDSLDGAWQSLKGSLAAGGNLADFEESMALLRREFGYDPDQQLLPALDGEWVLALLPSSEGLVTSLTGQPLGAVLLASGDESRLTAAVEDLNLALEGQRLPLANVTIDGATATFVDLESLVGAPLPLYGVDGEFLFIGTDVQLLDQVLAGESLLADVPTYAAAAALLPENYVPAAFVDLRQLSTLLSGGASDSSTPLLAPVQQLIAGRGPAADGIQPGAIFIIIE